MDSTLSCADLASALGTTSPRIHRAMRRGLIRPVPHASRRLRFDPSAAEVLRSRWGWTPKPADGVGLKREDLLVLAALSRRPLGLQSARAVARVAGISPTTAGRSLGTL